MNWYVLYVRLGREFDIKSELTLQGYTAMVPIEQRTERKGGTWQSREMILIPGYVFLETELTDQDYYRILNIPNIIRFLGVGRPEPLPANEAWYIDWLSNDGDPLGASDILADGEKITVASGPLKGFEGIIVRLNRRQHRAVIAITISGLRQEFTLSANVLRSDTS